MGVRANQKSVDMLAELEMLLPRCGRDAGGGAEHAHAQELLPQSGSLVLFDSKRVWHEVLPTLRERACLVGWYRCA